MKDNYPADSPIDPSWLVAPDDQPEYLDLPGRRLPDDANIARAILSAAPADATAIIHHETGEVLTFGDLGRRSTHLASLLKSVGVVSGDRVALRSGNCPETLLVA